METAEAFAPAHITGFFQICNHTADLLHKGSKGAGVSIECGVRTKVSITKESEESLEIRINGRKTSHAQVSEILAKDLLSRYTARVAVRINHTSSVPIGAGFGSSGAGALSLALALNKALNLNLDRIEAAQTAHKAEIYCNTGLGTVIAETFGGLELRVEPGAPGIGKIQQIPVTEDYVVACFSFGRLSTKKALTNSTLSRRINNSTQKLVDGLAEEPTLQNFLIFSREFAEQTGLITGRLRKLLRETDKEGFVCSIPIFGDGVFSIVKLESLPTLIETFQEYGPAAQIFVSKIDFKGARLL